MIRPIANENTFLNKNNPFSFQHIEGKLLFANKWSPTIFERSCRFNLHRTRWFKTQGQSNITDSFERDRFEYLSLPEPKSPWISAFSIVNIILSSHIDINHNNSKVRVWHDWRILAAKNALSTQRLLGYRRENDKVFCSSLTNVWNLTGKYFEIAKKIKIKINEF